MKNAKVMILNNTHSAKLSLISILFLTMTLLMAGMVRAESRPQLAFAKPAQVQAQPLPNTKLAMLMERFVSSYEAAQLDRFTALFAENVLTEDVDNRVDLRKQYEDFFNISTSRLFLLHSLDWHRKGEHFQGDGRFEVKIKGSTDPYVHSVTGRFQLEVAEHKGQLVITRLIYDSLRWK